MDFKLTEMQLDIANLAKDLLKTFVTYSKGNVTKKKPLIGLFSMKWVNWVCSAFLGVKKKAVSVPTSLVWL